MTIDPGILDRGVGVLLGLATGDALGSTLEFQPRDANPHHSEMVGAGPFNLKPGQWTDDTSMALALADSLLERGGLDPADLMDRFLAWYDDGAYSCVGYCFDIGNTTRSALVDYRDSRAAVPLPLDRAGGGNGTLMRVGPVSLFALRDPGLCLTVAARQSRLTHGSPEASEACEFFAGLLREAVLGAGRKVLEPRRWDGEVRRIAEIAGGSWRGLPRDRIRSGGYVVDTLAAALWCVDSTSTLEDALVLAVNLADDADTVGAVTGQLAGAIYGASAVPGRWLEPLAWRERIERTAADLVRRGAGAA